MNKEEAEEKKKMLITRTYLTCYGLKWSFWMAEFEIETEQRLCVFVAINVDVIKWSDAVTNIPNYRIIAWHCLWRNQVSAFSLSLLADALSLSLSPHRVCVCFCMWLAMTLARYTSITYFQTNYLPFPFVFPSSVTYSVSYCIFSDRLNDAIRITDTVCHFYRCDSAFLEQWKYLERKKNWNDSRQLNIFVCFCSTIYVSYMNVRPNCFYWSVCQPTESQPFPDGFSRLHEKMCVCVHLMIGNPKIWIKSKLSNSEKVSIHWHWKDCAKQEKNAATVQPDPLIDVSSIMSIPSEK